MTGRGGSLHARFLMSFFIALLPFAIFAWAFKPEQLRQRALGASVAISDPIVRSTAALRSEIGSALTLARFVATNARAGQCAQAASAVNSAVLRIRELSVRTADGTPLCDSQPGAAGPAVRYDGTALQLQEDQGGIIASIRLDITPVPPPPRVTSLMLFEPGGQGVRLWGAPVETPVAPLVFADPGQEFQLVSQGDGSLFAMRVFPTDYQLIALLDRNYAVPPFWRRALEGAVLPVSFVALSLLISSILIRRLALDDVQALRRDMARFGTDRAVPRPAPAGGSFETRAMRADFSDLADQLLTEEAIAQARLDHATTLQREVFHRVSNNFQIIQSIIRLIERNAGEPADIRERVALLSLAHHALHAKNDPALIGAAKALPRLLASLAQQGWFGGATLPLRVHIDGLSVDKTYGLLHLMCELLLRLAKSNAQDVAICLDGDGLRISFDASDLAVDPVGERLIAAYARSLGASVQWQPGAVVARFDTGTD